MKKFLINILKFLSPVLYFVIVGIINYQFYIKEGPDISNSRVLILGDSHIQRALNPTLFSDAQNVSQIAEPYVLTYWKLKKLHSYIEPDTLILGFSPHNISSFNDYKFFKEAWCSEMFRRSFPIHQFNLIDNKIEINYIEYYKVLFKEICLFPKKKYIKYIGEYEKKEIRKKNHIENWDETINRHFYIDNKECVISEISLNYLDSIISFCNEMNIVTILVRTPEHYNYYKKIPTLFLNTYNKIYHNYSQLLIIDDIGLNYNDSLFLDADHLNHYGAEQYTNDFLNEIKNYSNE